MLFRGIVQLVYVVFPLQWLGLFWVVSRDSTSDVLKRRFWGLRFWPRSQEGLVGRREEECVASQYLNVLQFCRTLLLHFVCFGLRPAIATGSLGRGVGWIVTTAKITLNLKEAGPIGAVVLGYNVKNKWDCKVPAEVKVRWGRACFIDFWKFHENLLN